MLPAHRRPQPGLKQLNELLDEARDASGSAIRLILRGTTLAVEPVVGHTKAEHRMGRNYLKGRDGDRINAVLAAAGYNFGLLLRWLTRLLRALFQAPSQSPPGAQPA